MERKECPFCGERIQRDALKCRYCREWLSEIEQPIIQEKEILVEQSSPIDLEKEKKEVTTPISIEMYIIIEKGSTFYLKSIPFGKDFQRT